MLTINDYVHTHVSHIVSHIVLQGPEERPRSRRQSFEAQDVNALGYEVILVCPTMCVYF